MLKKSFSLKKKKFKSESKLEISRQFNKKPTKESESFEHLRIKQYLLDNLPLFNDIKEIREEKKINNRRADIYLELKNNEKIVLEIQHSPISNSELIQRTADYTKQGIHVLWIFDGSTFSRYPYICHGEQMTSLEKTLHKLYYGRIYYINALEEGLATSVYPLCFAQYQERKVYRSGFAYYVRSKNKRSLVPGELSSFFLKTFSHEKLKLARFDDENVKTACKKEVQALLKQYKSIKENYRFNNSNLNEFEKLIFILMIKLEKKFGVHLLYDVLRQLKIIEKKEFFFLRSISEYIEQKILSL